MAPDSADTVDVVLSLASGLIGAVVGALVTAFVTRVQLRENARLAMEDRTEERRLVEEDRKRASESSDQQQKAVDELARLRHEGVQLYARVLASVDVKSWVTECDGWRKRVLVVLTRDFEYAVAEWFEDLGAFPIETFLHVVSDEHRHQLNMLAHSLRVLESIIDRNTRFARSVGVKAASGRGV